MRRILAVIAAVTIAFWCGFFIGSHRKPAPSSFHDMLVNHPHDFSGLITPKDKRVQALAAELKTPEHAYAYVRDRIMDDPSLPVTPPGEIIAQGRSSCLGKAVLLCTLYRAMGLPSSAVRVVIGEVSISRGIFDHAWVDMEHKGTCLQQDPTNILGTWSFDHFRGMAFVQAYVRDEECVFNDQNFAIVSQLNQFKGGGHPAIR